MRAKQYLQQYRKCKLRLKRLQEQIDELKDLVDGLSAPQVDGDRVQSSHEPDRMGEVIARKSDLEEELMIEIGNTLDLLNEIEATISAVSNVEYQLLLQKRYIRLETWEVIAEDMHYTSRWLFTMHGRALIEVEKLINGR